VYFITVFVFYAERDAMLELGMEKCFAGDSHSGVFIISTAGNTPL
jgi:hypothetical protein